MYFAALGEHDAAVQALQHAAAVRSTMLAQLKVAGWIDPVRADPRVQALLRELAFPPP